MCATVGERGRGGGALLVKVFHAPGLLTFGKIASDHSEEERKLYFADFLSFLHTQLAWNFVATWPSFLELVSSKEGTLLLYRLAQSPRWAK